MHLHLDLMPAMFLLSAYCNIAIPIIAIWFVRRESRICENPFLQPPTTNSAALLRHSPALKTDLRGPCAGTFQTGPALRRKLLAATLLQARLLDSMEHMGTRLPDFETRLRTLERHTTGRDSSDGQSGSDSTVQP